MIFTQLRGAYALEIFMDNNQRWIAWHTSNPTYLRCQVTAEGQLFDETMYLEWNTWHVRIVGSWICTCSISFIPSSLVILCLLSRSSFRFKYTDASPRTAHNSRTSNEMTMDRRSVISAAAIPRLVIHTLSDRTCPPLTSLDMAAINIEY